MNPNLANEPENVIGTTHHGNHASHADECDCVRDENGECGCLRDRLQQSPVELSEVSD